VQPSQCPHCGAPAQIPPATQLYTCGYCKQQFDTGYRQPQAFPQKPVQQQIIIVRGPDDGDEHPHSSAVASSAIARGISWLVWTIVMVVIVLVVGGGALFAFVSKQSSFASSLVWDGKTPFTCGGNDDVSVKGVHAELASGTAITVNNNCSFTCTDCTIKAPTAIEVGGNGSVTIVNGSITGTELLVDASANAHVNISGNVTASGLVKQAGNARISGAPPAPSASSSAKKK
jgi:hypothetical protein